MQQIHSRGIAHQDLKPSNVLIFNSEGTKIADFGRAAYAGHSPPHENYEVAGDRTYAPPELLYHYIDPNWNLRRYGCDAYLLGSLAIFFFLGTGATTLLFSKLPPPYHYNSWKGSYEDVLPYLKDAFQKVLLNYKAILPIPLQKIWLKLFRNCVNPSCDSVVIQKC